MNILFVHQNFPGQFKFLAPELAKRGHLVVALTLQKHEYTDFEGVHIIRYSLERGTAPNIHPWLSDFEPKAIRAEACLKTALKLKDAGFSPEVIIAHPGWGESLFLKEVWPKAKLGIYCEFFYQPHGADVGFDLEFSTNDLSDACRIRLKNINNLLHFEVADAGISPTHWQASTFPEPFKSKITVVHDGIDTRSVIPNSDVAIAFKNSNGDEIRLTKNDEVITFVNRNLEPYRGYHIFMRALPEILKARPSAHVLIVGGDDVSYGARPTAEKNGGSKWKEIFIDEVRSQISDSDWRRIHFLGSVSYQHFVSLVQVSSVHVYLTYPFILSWSLLEAMSAGCAIVASDTQPLREAIKHDETGRLFNFFDFKALAQEVVQLLEDPVARMRLGSNARSFAIDNFDLKTICLPRQLQWIEGLMK